MIVIIYTLLSNSPACQHVFASGTSHDAIERLFLNGNVFSAAIQNHMMNDLSVVKDGLSCYNVIILIMWQLECFAVIRCLLSWHLLIGKCGDSG